MPYYGVVDKSDVDPTEPFPFIPESEAEEMRIEINILRRYLSAALDALDFAHSEGFEWPTDPLGDEALAFTDPTTALERIAGGPTNEG